jgi:V/A-type H+-transporting ATPase subunit A
MFCTPERQIALLRIILTLYRNARELIQAGVPLARVRSLTCVPQELRAKTAFGNTEMEKMAQLERRVIDELEGLAKESVRQSA